MKVNQTPVVGWVSKLMAARSSRQGQKQAAVELRVLDAELLRKVSGGDGTTMSPGKTW